MRRLFTSLAILFSLGTAALAADGSVPSYTAGGAIADTDIWYCAQSAGTLDRKCTSVQLATYIFGKVSGSLSCTGTGTCTVTTNANLTGDVTSVGNATTYAGVVPAAKGGAGTITGALKGSGAGVVSQAACADLSNGATGCSTAVGTSGATIGLLNAANSWSAVQTFAASDIVLTGGSGCATFTAGVLGSTGSACGGSGSTGANPTATASDTAVNGVATTFMRSDGAPAIQKTSSSLFGLAKVDGTSITATGGVISATGAVSSVTGGIGVTVSPTTGAVVVSNTITQRNNTTTSDTLISTDAGTLVTESNASPVAVGIAAAGGAGFLTTTPFSLKNKGAGVVTLTPTTSQIDGQSSIQLKQNQSIDFYSDGTNYWSMPGRPVNVAASDLVGIGTNVAAAVNTTLSAAGGLTSTIASGTSAMGTSAIASAACATVVTTTATNTATTDVVTASFNGDPTAVTGYIPATAGMLTIIAYPTANNVNFKVCNNTSASITPGAITLNWRVVR